MHKVIRDSSPKPALNSLGHFQFIGLHQNALRPIFDTNVHRPTFSRCVLVKHGVGDHAHARLISLPAALPNVLPGY